MIAAVGGALVAGRRAAVIRPTQALAEVSLEGRTMTWPRAFFALFFLGGGIALGIVTVTVMSGPLTSSTAGPAVILWAIGLALLSPALTRMMTAVLQWPIRAVSGLSGRLAVLNAKARRARTAAVVAPVILLTGIATGTLYLQATEDHANRQAFADGLVADAVVTLQGVTAEGAAATTPVSVTDGALSDLRGDSMAIATDHADRLGVGVGDTITMRLGDNASLDVEIVALFNAADGYGTLLMPADVLAAHTTEGGVEEILVKADDEGDTATMVAGLTEMTAGQTGLVVADRDALFEAHADQQQTMAFANYTVVIMIVAYAAITVINTLVSSTAARRREFGLQRLTGSTRGQVMRMVGLEGVLVAVIGVVLGTVASIATLVPFSVARVDSLTPSGSPLIYAAVVGAALVLALGGTLVPGWQAMRGRPAEAAVAVE